MSWLDQRKSLLIWFIALIMQPRSLKIGIQYEEIVDRTELTRVNLLLRERNPVSR